MLRSVSGIEFEQTGGWAVFILRNELTLRSPYFLRQTMRDARGATSRKQQQALPFQREKHATNP
jgi:hypothetical protein